MKKSQIKKLNFVQLVVLSNGFAYFTYKFDKAFYKKDVCSRSSEIVYILQGTVRALYLQVRLC